MTNNAALPLTTRTLWKAYYRTTGIPEYAGNPLIETLPPLYTRDEVRKQLAYKPRYREADRRRPPHERLHLLLSVLRFFEPLPRHFELEQSIARMLRGGYVGRNPAQPGYWPNSLQKVRSVRSYILDQADPIATQGLSLVGISGTGKSRTASRITHMYPQVICHNRYRGRAFTHVQLVWLKLDCPQDGSVIGLAKDFFTQVDHLLDTNYYQRYAGGARTTLDTLIISMANVCRLNSVGLLVIDEIQNLRQAHGQGSLRFLNFLTQLDNTIGVPIMLIGTPAALPAFTGEFRRARRAEGAGEIPWDRMVRHGSGEWDLFLEALWKYQYLAKTCDLTPALSDVIYDETQGIVDLAIKLFLLAQVQAIRDGSDELSEELTRKTACERFRYVERFIKQLRARTHGSISTWDGEFDDITMPGRLPDVAQVISDAIGEFSSPPPEVPVCSDDSTGTPSDTDGEMVEKTGEHSGDSTGTGGQNTVNENAAGGSPSGKEDSGERGRRGKQKRDQQTPPDDSTRSASTKKPARAAYDLPDTTQFLRSAREFTDEEPS